MTFNFKKETKKNISCLYRLWNENNIQIKELYDLWHKCDTKIDNLDTHSGNKWTEHQKSLTEINKKIEMLINSENETRLAVKTIAEILAKKGIIKITKKGEQKNEWTKSKPNNSKQNFSKHSKPGFVQK